MPTRDSTGGSSDERLRVEWEFLLGESLSLWDWSALPDPHVMGSVRQIARPKWRQRHNPVWAYSVTTGGHVRLESGFEHDLVREVDRRRDVVWLVAQPALLRWEPCRTRADVHVPDLLTMDRAGAVTVWDARPAALQDDDFVRVADRTRAACVDVGWSYQVFGGVSPVRRMNIMWLSGFRREMPWHAAAWSMIQEELATGCTIGQLRHLDRGFGHVVSTMWHAVWSGAVSCDLEAAFTADTRLGLTGEPIGITQ